MTRPTVTPIRSPFNHVVAFEVSKQTLVVHTLPAGLQQSIANQPQAVRRLLRAELKSNRRAGLGPLLVICEATGGYERAVLDAAGLAVHKAHGTRVRFFARYRGLLAKTDAIDARLLAEYGLASQALRLYVPPPAHMAALRALKGRRTELQEMIIAETNRLEQARHQSVVRSLNAHLEALKAALAAIEAEIAALVRGNDEFAGKTRLMQSPVGVGSITAATLLAYVPELGALTKGQAARLAGLAPINRDSGRSSSPRHIEPGRHALRRCLYMAAVVAMRYNHVLRAFAERLSVNGKSFKIVVTAVMRKIVVILNGILAEQKPWRHAKPA